MYEFSYHKSGTVSEAVEAMQKADDGKYVAGGHTMLPTMKHRLASPSDLIDLSGIDELQGISVDGDTVTIGAMSTHASVAASADVQAAIPALAKLAGNIGDPAVRNRGTIGGRGGRFRQADQSDDRRGTGARRYRARCRPGPIGRLSI